MREGAAFGLAVNGTVDVEGLAPASGTGERRVELRRVPRAAVEAVCPAREGVRLGGVGRGRGAANLLDHGEAGMVWRAPGFGLFRLSRDGRELDCAPVRSAAWWWQRLLIGQALPLAALVQGLEVLHAGAVAAGGGAIALTADAGVGKSTLVAALVAQGAGFLADDVVAVEPAEEGVLVHPGATVMSMRPGAPEGLDSIGDVVGRNAHETRLRLDRVDAPVPLRALVVLSRGGPAGLEPLDPSDPRPLLAATFNRAVVDPARLAQQFDVCARIAAGAQVLSLGVDTAVAPSVAARAILGALA